MWIIFIGISSNFERAFHAAHELGLRIFLITTGNHLPANINGLSDLVKIVKDFELEEITALVKSHLPNERPVFWTLKDQLLPLVSMLNRHFDPPANFYSDTLVATCKNKLKLRQALEKTPYNPNFELYVQGSPLDSLLDKGPKVIKPLLGYSSIGVELLTSNENVPLAIERSMSVLKKISSEVKNLPNSGEYDVNKTLLVEEYVDGDEFSVEIFANKNGMKCLGVCEKSKMNEPYFEEISYCVPARLNETVYNKLTAAAMEIMSILGFHSGVAHLEFRCDADRITLLDIGLRLGGGGLTHTLIHTATGMDVVKAVIAELCNKESEPYLVETRKDTALLYLLQVEEGGCIKEFAQPDIKPEDGELMHLCFLAQKRDRISGYPNYSGLPGYLVLRIPGRNTVTFSQVDKVFEKLRNGWRIEYQ